MHKETSVLIIDDDETFCRYLAEILEGRGMQVTWTTDGFHGYEMSLRHTYDLFILDVRMPLVFGNELAEDIREDNPRAKIILISAFADDPLRKTAEKLGVSILSKPFSPERLLEEIDKTLAREA